MVYTWGTKPQYSSEENVSGDYTFQKGEIAIMRGAVYKSHSWNILPSRTRGELEKQVSEKVMSIIRGKGGIPLYISTRITAIHEEGGLLGFVKATYEVTVEECVFKADPVVIPTLVAALIVVAIIIGELLLFLRPVWLKAAGISPTEALGYDVGTILIIIALVIGSLVFVVWLYPTLTGKKRRR